MTSTNCLTTKYLPFPLIALMALTRYHHFGDLLHLPDASLAVFFFAGFYRVSKHSNTALLAFLLALAGLIDYLAIANGTSAWCVTPAYLFLIPTYAALWLAGGHCATLNLKSLPSLATATGWLLLAATVAFVISNGSFYLFSDYFKGVTLSAYSAKIAVYYLPYVSSALLYTLCGFALTKTVGLIPVQKQTGKQA
jgi:hypothetical protein